MCGGVLLMRIIVVRIIVVFVVLAFVCAVLLILNTFGKNSENVGKCLR